MVIDSSISNAENQSGNFKHMFKQNVKKNRFLRVKRFKKNVKNIYFILELII